MCPDDPEDVRHLGDARVDGARRFGTGRAPETTKPRRIGPGFRHSKSGNDLLSRTVTRAVPSALRGLTAEFGMGSGVTPSLWSPEFHILTVG